MVKEKRAETALATPCSTLTRDPCLERTEQAMDSSTPNVGRPASGTNQQQYIFGNPYGAGSGLIEMCAATCDTRDLAYMCGATWEQACDAANAVLATFKSELPQYFTIGRTYNRQKKPYVYRPRRDWSKASCRLPEKHWLPLRAQIFKRDGYVCAYCGDREAKMVIDHIVPISRGGSNYPENLCVACYPCNSSKNDKLLSEWTGRYIY